MTFHADEYKAAAGRYRAGMPYRRVGRSGLDLPAVSLGLWHNFGDDVPLERQQATLRRAFDRGVTHFDLANNYGPPYGSAERNFGTIFARDFRPYRDELVISSKAGYDMWPGPYGQGGGSRKYLIASCDQSLQRMGLDYVDIFYSHRFDETTPLEETLGALDSLVRAGQGALRRHLVVLRRPHPRGRRDHALDGHAAAHPPAVVLDAQPLDRGGPARRRRRDRPGPDRVLPARAGHAHQQVPQGHPGGLACGTGQVARPLAAHRRPRSSTSGPSTGWPRPAASPSRRWPSPGRCATSGSPPCSSGRRRSSSSTTASMPSRTSKFTAEELAKIDKHAVDAGINLWKTSSEK